MSDIDTLFENEKVLQMVVFTLGREEYCIPIMNVQEIIMPQDMTKIPRSPDFIEGVINLRGNIVPIIDGCKRFQIPETDCKKQKSEERIVVLDINHHTMGLVVNDVSEVINVHREQIDVNPTTSNNDADFILGIAKLDKRLLIMLSPEKFLDMGEMQSLANISQVVKQMSPPSVSQKEKATEKAVENTTEKLPEKTTEKIMETTSKNKDK